MPAFAKEQKTEYKPSGEPTLNCIFTHMVILAKKKCTSCILRFDFVHTIMFGKRHYIAILNEFSNELSTLCNQLSDLSLQRGNCPLYLTTDRDLTEIHGHGDFYSETSHIIITG